jgi:hypothetical protein
VADKHPDGPHDVLARHVEMSARVIDLLRAGENARDAGRLGEAWNLLAQAEALNAEIWALERSYKPPAK